MKVSIYLTPTFFLLFFSRILIAADGPDSSFQIRDAYSQDDRITLTVGQAIIVYLSECRDENIQVKLKKLYLNGVCTQDDKELLDSIRASDALQDFNISRDPEFINNDATRRYFETHLFMNTLKHHLADISFQAIHKHYLSILDLYTNFGGDLDEQKYRDLNEVVFTRNYEREAASRISSGLSVDDLVKGVDLDFQKNEIDDTFLGLIDTERDPNPKREYKDLIARVGINNELNLNQDDKEKVVLLIKCARMASFLVELERRFKGAGKFFVGVDVPGQEVYESGMFLPENRGKISKNAPSTGSHNLGIIAGKMPLSINDKAFAASSFKYLKPAEMSTYNIDAKWVREVMAQQVHPFINGVSGTIFIQLRMLAALAKNGNLSLDRETFKPYILLMMSAMGSISGGHSLVEFVGTFQLEQVKDFLRAYGSDDLIEGLNLQSMFGDGNYEAFDEALTSTIIYNQQIIAKKRINNQINAIQR